MRVGFGAHKLSRKKCVGIEKVLKAMLLIINSESDEKGY